jgi:metal-responsive CopG/Arc/MetJ family transcriptional regulator
MPKTKVSVTVEGSLLRQVERMARGASRSEVVEIALASPLRGCLYWVKIPGEPGRGGIG